MEVETCKDFDTPMASTLSKVLVVVPSGSTLLVDMFKVVSSHEESNHEVSSEDTIFYHNTYSGGF